MSAGELGGNEWLDNDQIQIGSTLQRSICQFNSEI